MNTELVAAETGSVAQGPDSTVSETIAFGLGAADLAAVSMAALFVLAFAPQTMFPSWTPRMSLLVLAGLPGLLALGWQALSRDRAAVLVMSFLGVVVVSACFSASPRSSLVGFAGRDLSVLTLLAAFGVWAVARSCTDEGRRVTVVAFTGAATAAAGVGLLQVIAGIERGSLALQDGRPMAFLINPVYFGAVCAAAAVIASRSAGSRFGLWHGAALLTAAGCIVSGSRVAWVALVLLVLAQLALDRSSDRVRGAAAAFVGVVVGLTIDRIVSGGNSVGRVADGTTGGRLDVWKYSLQSWLERPLLGHGVGLFRPAIQDRFTFDFVRGSGTGELERVWFDPHNVVIAVLVATGVVGLIALSAAAAVVVRHARGPATWGVVAIAMTWLLQPVSIHTLPIAMLLLGVAMPLSATAGRPPRPPVRVFAPAALVAVLLALSLVVADLRLRDAVDRPSYAAAVSAARWFPGDSVVAGVVARVARWDSATGGPNDRSVDWRRQSIEREPDRPFWWNELAAEEAQLGNLDAAEQAVDVALDLQPANLRANALVLEIAARRQDRDAVEEQLEVLCELDVRSCDIDVADVLGAG